MELTNITIDNLIRSKRRTISLQIENDGRLSVRAPLRTSLRSIHEFIHEKRLWILRTQEKVRKTFSAPKEFKDGELFLFLGDYYPLTITDQAITPLTLDNGFRLLRSHIHQARRLFKHWYQDQAKILLISRTQTMAHSFSLNYKSIKLSNAKTRWGSCSANGRINLSWRLIMAPPHVMEYVIAHELAHLKELNHSKKFWNIVEELYPNYKEARKWLRQYGHDLTI